MQQKSITFELETKELSKQSNARSLVQRSGETENKVDYVGDSHKSFSICYLAGFLAFHQFIDFGKLIFCPDDLCTFVRSSGFCMSYVRPFCCWLAGDFGCMPKSGNWLQEWLGFMAVFRFDGGLRLIVVKINLYNFIEELEFCNKIYKSS